MLLPLNGSIGKEFPVILGDRIPSGIEYIIEASEHKQMGDENVVECITSQSHETKPSLQAALSAVQKRKLVGSSPERESSSAKTSVAYEDLVKIVCSNSRQGCSGDDNFDLVGKNVAMKLRNMESTQKAIAERLIGEILFQGQMEMLAVNTTITTPNTNNMTTTTPLRSIVINAASALQARRDAQESTKTTYIIAPHESAES
ncbi:uncharacterized protein [Hetaerina americana]|uniref:uncharacterized protein isoform X2 n=1 Tax=Hetaerina americana TaxID=62018 RepID=UPI003A7F2DFB